MGETDALHVAISVIVSCIMITFAIYGFELDNKCLLDLAWRDKSYVNSNSIYEEGVDYQWVYKKVLNLEDTTEMIDVKDHKSTIYDDVTVLTAFAIQGNMMPAERLYLGNRYITKAGAAKMSFTAAVRNLDIAGTAKYILEPNYEDARFSVVDGNARIYVIGEE